MSCRISSRLSRKLSRLSLFNPLAHCVRSGSLPQALPRGQCDSANSSKVRIVRKCKEFESAKSSKVRTSLFELSNSTHRTFELFELSNFRTPLSELRTQAISEPPITCDELYVNGSERTCNRYGNGSGDDRLPAPQTHQYRPSWPVERP